jgi:FkbM family methyltransferase
MHLRSLIRNILNTLHLDVTRNLAYDRLTREIMHRVIASGTNCVDVGCHKGEMLDMMISLAPSGIHFAFEPIPSLYQQLFTKYQGKAHVYPCALSDFEGNSTFQYIQNAPAYSGLKERHYAIKHPDIREIDVQVKRLDDLIPEKTTIGFIKLDVEGGEFGVLKGALRVIKESRPVIIFECGLGASDYYNTEPEAIYSLITREAGLQLSLLSDWLKSRPPLSGEAFLDIYRNNSEWYFVAHPER